MEQDKPWLSWGCANATLFLCFGILVSLESQRFAYPWFTAALAVLVIRWGYYRYSDRRPCYRVPSLYLCLIPLALTLGGTTLHLVQETDPGSYKEMENAVLLAKPEAVRQDIRQQVQQALADDGKISVWVSTRIRASIMDKIGWMMRADAAPTQEAARRSLQNVLNEGQINDGV